MTSLSLVSSVELKNWKEATIATKESLFEAVSKGEISLKHIKLTYDVTDTTLYKLLKNIKLDNHCIHVKKIRKHWVDQGYSHPLI